LNHARNGHKKAQAAQKVIYEEPIFQCLQPDKMGTGLPPHFFLPFLSLFAADGFAISKY
jgi:hypothetical protein